MVDLKRSTVSKERLTAREKSGHNSTIVRQAPETMSAGYSRYSSGGVEPPPKGIRPSFLAKFCEKTAKIHQGGEWVPFSIRETRHLLSCGPPCYEYASIYAATCSEEMKAELLRFLLCLELWEQTPGQKLLDAQTIWLRSLQEGSKFADELSDWFAYSLRGGDPPDSYNSVFPARFLPKWEEGADDLQLCKTATSAELDTLDEFRMTLSDILREAHSNCDGQYSFPSDKEILFEKSTTTSYSKRKKSKMPHWEAALTNSEFNYKELYGLRCEVPVYPSGVRDTIIADITANNSIRWIERSMRTILQYVPESAVTLYPSTYQKRLDDVVYCKGSHVWRDIKKCGITFNTHDLFPIVKECLQEFFPDPRWRRLDIFSNMVIKDGDEEYQALRGYGLGMANHVVTLCNTVIHRMARNALPPSNNKVHVRAIIGNDDSDVCISSKVKSLEQSYARMYLDLELDIHTNLGNLVNLKKSVIMEFGLFYETYDLEGWKNKESLICNALASAYLAPDIRTAKHYISSQSDRFNHLWAYKQLKALAMHWGGEFFTWEEECLINSEVGGWLNTSSCGLKTTLRDIEKLSQKYETEFICYAYEVCKSFHSAPKPHWSKTEEVNNQYYMGKSKKTSNRYQLFFLGFDDTVAFYKKLTTYQRVYSSRFAKYKSKIRKKDLTKDLLTLLKRVNNRSPWYTLPDAAIDDFHYWPEEPLRYDATSEMLISPLDSTTAIIEEVANNDINHERDDQRNFCYGTIPAKIFDYALELDAGQLLLASQFSNSGYLPIYEFFRRHGTYPLVKFFSGRIRFSELPVERDRVEYFSLSRFSVPKKDKGERKIVPIYEKVVKVDAWGGEDCYNYDCHEVEEEIDDFFVRLVEERPKPEPVIVEDYVPSKEMELAIAMIDQMMDPTRHDDIDVFIGEEPEELQEPLELGDMAGDMDALMGYDY
jgi:hypothetical protein